MVILMEDSVLIRGYLLSLLKIREKEDTAACLPVRFEKTEDELTEKTLNKLKEEPIHV